ncbi:MAG: ATP-dependent DNA helicase RecG [Paludibacteraceae bacterium]|nr:ATP-dependent DNA helicase RecG [Paludibacteraceae bacterium]
MPEIKELQYLKGVGPQRAKLLETELGIKSIDDLLHYFPYRYVDRSHIYSVRDLRPDMPYVQLRGYISGFQTIGEGRKKRITATFADNTGKMELTWFKGLKYVENKFSNKPNTEFYVFGKPVFFGGKFSIVHPEIDEQNPMNEMKVNGLQAMYNTTEKMKSAFLNSKALQTIMYAAVKHLQEYPQPESLPEYLIEKYRFMRLNYALRNVHFPVSQELLKLAQNRLKFEELFYIQLSILRKRIHRENNTGGLLFPHIGDYFNRFYKNNLPFELTNAQKRVLREIRSDVGSGKQMNRLLQGDVGSGKTLVALMAMLMAADNNYQACMMAPTEILATQHYLNLSEMLQGTGVNIALLTGSTKKKERDEIHSALRNGSLHILIGTHALIEDTVQFQNLGLVVIDEQHRFGVEQRAKLWSKNDTPPHILVMTATPIPRTLAMTIYGDLRVSVIDELPPGRTPIQTYHYYDNKRDSINNFIRTQVQSGRQIYIVYPLIQESEKIDLKNLEDGYEDVKKKFPEFNICMVHGKMKPAEKEEEMQKFVRGEAQIMVATTVIEVGVNVPNATVMIIENANRFGLSQLHQLRGRVGRGSNQSYCILMSPYQISQETKQRLEIMVQTNDGFEISEADLKMRGPGDMEGTAQSGLPFELRIANLAKDEHILEFARKVALEILQDDPRLEKQQNSLLPVQLAKMTHIRTDLSEIS